MRPCNEAQHYSSNQARQWLAEKLALGARRYAALLRGLDLRLFLRPVIGRGLGALERLFGLEAWRHRAVQPSQDLVVLDVERAQPALLAHGDGDEIADLDQLGLAEMLVQPRPELVVDRQVPGDRLGVR